MKTLLSLFVRYKIYHLPFWIVYHYFWWALTIDSPIGAAENIFFSYYKVKFFVYVIVQALGVYFNLYYLIPHFLQRGEYVKYGISFFLTIGGTSLLIVSGYYLNAFVTGIPLADLFAVRENAFWVLFKSNAFPSTVASMTLAMSIKLGKNWLSSEQRRSEIEKEKLQTELKYLRSQLNPHFLFNTINSIFVLIHKNQDLASDSLAKFSELLRYQLYQSNESFIPLSQEVDYVKNFIELEKLRYDTRELQMTFDIDESNIGALQIAPFLLIPFIENSFKHVSHFRDKPNWIEMELGIDDGLLKFQIRNSKQMMKVRKDEGSGVGLVNVKRRLSLLYPNAHVLSISQAHEEFSISLSLELGKGLNLQKQSA